MAASLSYRLPKRAWGFSSCLGLTAVLLPAVVPHFAKNRWDLLGLVMMAVLTFAANMHASRSRVAQLPLTWRVILDVELRHLADQSRK